MPHENVTRLENAAWSYVTKRKKQYLITGMAILNNLHENDLSELAGNENLQELLNAMYRHIRTSHSEEEAEAPKEQLNRLVNAIHGPQQPMPEKLPPRRQGLNVSSLTSP